MAGEAAAERVRASDRILYASTLYAPADRRPALHALHAFAIEVAGIRERISQPLPGEIRFQWWRDAIAAGVPTGNPLADALIAAIARFELPVAAFQNLLEARIFDLYDDPMPSRTDLEGYLGETESALVQLAALVLDRESAPGAAGPAGHAGCAVGVANLLLALPRWRARGQCYVPHDILSAVGITPEEFVAGADDARSSAAVAAMVALGREHAAASARHAAALPAALRPAFMPAAIATLRLRQWRDAADLMSGNATDVPAWRGHWALLRAASGRWPGL